MKILLWHGYLLSGTGSNIYTQAVAREWARAGHDVTVVCQEPCPERFDLAGAKVVRPELPDGLLPVFVVDRYHGLEPRLLQDLTSDQRSRYVDANAAAIRRSCLRTRSSRTTCSSARRWPRLRVLPLRSRRT